MKGLLAKGGAEFDEGTGRLQAQSRLLVAPPHLESERRRQRTDSMILPTCCEDSISACAAAASASGKTLVDDGLELAALEHRPDVLAERDRQGELALVRARSQRGARHGEAAHHDVPPVDLHPAAAQKGDHHEAALERQALQVLLDVVAADHVEDDVDARLAGDARDLGDEVFGPVVDRVIGAERPAKRRLVVASRRRQHRRAELLRELDRGEADAAGAAVDEQLLAALQAAAIDDVVPDGEVVFGQARGFERGEPGGDRQAEARGCRAELRIAAARRQRADGIAVPP